jgi:hypothetical protein
VKTRCKPTLEAERMDGVRNEGYESSEALQIRPRSELRRTRERDLADLVAK